MAQKLKLHSPVGADPLILKWPVPTSEGKDGPEEILDTIRLVCDDYPELKTPLDTRILKEGEDVSNYDYEQTKAMCERYNKAIDSLRQLVKGHTRQKSVSKQASMKQLKHILQQCYNHSVKDPEKLNHYEPFSPEVYGETSFELVEQMIKYVKFSESDYFIDLGSGVGQVVLQVSAATNCKFCYGVEKAEWPAEYAAGMEREFRKWMKWYGKEHGEFKIEKGDFLHDGVKEKLNKATIVFVNNFAFGPVVDHELKQRFANSLKEGARIVSSKAFCPLNFRITARNLSDIGTIMQVEELSPLCGAVSWTGKPFAYYVHTIDRALLEKYFNRLRHPSKKDDIEPRKDRKGRPLLSIKDKINGALSGGSDSNSSGRWRRVRGLQREIETVSPLSAAKVLDFDSESNSSFTNSGGAPTVDDSSIVYGPTTRRQWNEYVKRPQSQSGTENDNDSSENSAEQKFIPRSDGNDICPKTEEHVPYPEQPSGCITMAQHVHAFRLRSHTSHKERLENDYSRAETPEVANIDVKSKDQAQEIIQKKKRMKTVKRLNNGALGKRQMQVGKKSEPLSPVKSKAAVKLRPRQKQVTRSSAPKRAVTSSASSTASSVSTTTSTVSSNLSAHTNGTILAPSLDSLNLLHAHTIMSTSGKDPAEKVNYNDRRMTETSNAYFKPTVQKQTVSMLEKEAGFLHMIETMKQRFLSFLTFMQSPEYRAMLLLQIEQEKRKNISLKGQAESLERDISLLQKDGVRLIKDRLKEMGIKADTPREVISQAKDIMLRHHELKSQTASLGAQINTLQTEHNQKVTAYRKVLDRKFAMRQAENGCCEHTYHMMNKDHLDQQRLLANINRLHTELQHLQNVNKPYVVRPEAGGTTNSSLDLELSLALEGKGVVKGNGSRPPVSSYTVKEKLDMKENYEAFGTVLTMVKKEVTAALQNSSASQISGLATKLEVGHVSDIQSVGVRQETTDRTLTVSVDLKSNTPPWCAKDASAKGAQCSSIQSFKTPEALVKEKIDGSSKISQIPSSWTSDVRKDGTVTSTSPRILPPGMKIDIKKPSRLNGLNTTLKAKVCHPGNYALLQNSDNLINQSYKVSVNGSFSTLPTFNLYTENEKSVAEDLISLKDILSTPTASIEPQGTLLNKVPVSSLSSSLTSVEYVQNHSIDSKTSSRKHSLCDNTSTILVPNKPHTGSSNSLRKDSSVSCAITPSSSTSHAFAQVPVANLSQTGSNSSHFIGQNNQILNMTSSIQMRPVQQNKVKILTSVPKNGLLKHKNYDSSLIHPPIKVRTLEAGNEVKLSMPSVLSTAFYAQSPQQAQIVQAPSGTSIAHVLKSESGHIIPNQSFLNAHMGQTVVVSSANVSTVGSSSLPFVTIQSPHAIPVCQGSNGVQPSLIKILQQKQLIISPKSSTIFNGTTSNSGSTGSLIAVAPSINSQGTIAQADCIGQTLKIMPPNGRDAKGCLHSPEPCSHVVSEFDAFVPLASTEHKYCNHNLQECDHQQAIPTYSDDMESASESSEEMVRNNIFVNDINCATKKQSCCCYLAKFSKCQRELPPKILKVSSESCVNSSEKTSLTTIPSPLPFSELEPMTVKESSYKKYSNSPSVILKREAKLEKMAECIPDSESKGRRISDTESQSTNYEEENVNRDKERKPTRSSRSHKNRSQKYLEESVSSQSIVNEEQSSDTDSISVLTSRKRKPQCNESHQDSKKSSRIAERVHAKTSQDKTDTSLPERKTSCVEERITTRPSAKHFKKSHSVSKTYHKHSKLYKLHPKHSSSRNEIDKKDTELSCKTKIVTSAPCVDKTTENTDTKLMPSHSHVITEMRDDQNLASIQSETCLIQSDKQFSLPKSEISSMTLTTDKYKSDAKLYNNNDDHLSSISTPAKQEEKQLLFKSRRSSVSMKLREHSTSKSERSTSGNNVSAIVDSNCSSLRSVRTKPGRHHTSSKEHKSHTSSKTSKMSTDQGHSWNGSEKGKVKSVSQRNHKDTKSSSYLRSSSSLEERHQSSAKYPKKHSSSRQREISPGPPKLERAVSPPSHQRKCTVETKISSLNSESVDPFPLDPDTTNIDLWSKFCENSDKRNSSHKRSKFSVSSIPRGKTTSSKCQNESREPSLSPKLANRSTTKSERTSVSSKRSRNSKSCRMESTRQEERNTKSLRSSRIKEPHGNNDILLMKSQTKEKIERKSSSSTGLRRSQSKCDTELNNKTATECIKDTHGKTDNLTSRNTPNKPLHDKYFKEINKNKSVKEHQHIYVTEKIAPNDTGQCDTPIALDTEMSPQTELDTAKTNEESTLSANLDSPYGLLTPKSIPICCQMDEDKNSEGEHVQPKDCTLNITHKHEQMVDLGIEEAYLKNECPTTTATITVPEAESFPFPPTPGKTPRSASVPCSPETNTQTIEEPIRLISEEVKPGTDGSIDDISVRKGPQTPPGSPLFNHQSQSRSRSLSVSSSSSRGSSCDSCHSTSSSSSLSDCSSDDTRRRKRNYQHHHKIPPRKLSTLITPVSLGIGSPPKATVLYSPMPSANMNGFNYGIQVRPGLGSASAPVFGNYGAIGTSALSPLSVSTQQSHGYQMVTSDLLRSPNSLLRSPVGGGLFRQHSVFSPSPVSSTVSTMTSSSQSYAAFKDINTVQTSKSINTIAVGGCNMVIMSDAMQLDQNKVDSFSPIVKKTLPISTSRLLSVTEDSHSTELGTSSSRLEKLDSSKSCYKVKDSSDIVKDHNANNTSLCSSHSSSSHLQHEAPIPIDYNQNLCMISTSCCSISPTESTSGAVIGIKPTNLALETVSLCCNNKLNSKFSASDSDKKNSLETVGSYTSRDNFASLVIEKNTYQSSLLPLYQSPSTPPFTNTVSTPDDCTDSFISGAEKVQPTDRAHTSSNSYLACTLQQNQEMQCHLQPSASHYPNSATQSQQLTQLPKTKQQPLIAQSQQHLSPFHQTSSPPPLPHQQLHMPRQSRQKSPGHSPHTGHYNLHSHHSFKGHNLGNRRAGFGYRAPLSHYPSPWGNMSPQVYLGPYCQNGPPHLNKPRHTGQSPGFRNMGDSSLTDHTNSSIMDYPLHGSLTQPYGSGQWDHPTPPYCTGLGSAGLGRSCHQHYSHLYPNKHHH